MRRPGRHWRGYILLGNACLTALSVVSSAALAQQPSPRKFELLSAGADEAIWILVGQFQPHEKGIYSNYLVWADKASSEMRPIPGPLTQTGRPARVALAGQNLHVFFEDGTHYRYTPRLSRRELRLPDETAPRIVPEALAGEAAQGAPRIWAVVKAGTADAVATEYLKMLQFRASQPAPQTEPAAAPATRPSIGARSEQYHIVSYDGEAWRPELPASPIAGAAERIWLCAAAGRIHLFWQQTPRDADIQYAWHEDGNWSQGAPIRLSEHPAAGFIGIGNRHLVFTSMTERGRSWQPSVYMRPEREAEGSDAAWTPKHPLQLGDGKPLLLPAGSTVSVFGDQIAIVRPAAEHAEIAFWRVSGGKPEQPFTQVQTRKSVLEPGERTHRDLRIALALGLLLLLVFWRRHTTFAAPVPLPPGAALAGTGRRTIAALLDLAPAAVFVAWWWAKPLQAAVDEMNATGDPAQLEAAFSDVIFWPSITFRLIYIAYCIAFELIWSRTPGKWLLGCTVISETGGAPTWIQTVVRNVTRIIEFHPDPPIFLPLLLLVFITRNRQRVGDLLAHTIVVEAAPVIEDSPEDERT